MFISAQITSPEVISSSGAYFSNTSGSMSWTLGETVTETFSNGSNILTQGFQQPVSVSITGIDLDLLVYLEGPFNGADMNTDLTGHPEPVEGFPLSQPYNTAPWNYNGTESVVTIPPDVVDWVLVELRDATDAASATPATIIATQAAFLLSDGSVVGLDGSSNLYFDASVFNNLFAVVWHRNHLGILSANALAQSGMGYTYDFSTGNSQAYGVDAQRWLGGGIYGMIGGDANADGDVNGDDKTEVWNFETGNTGYLGSDGNLDGQANNQDKNDIWHLNSGKESQIPD